MCAAPQLDWTNLPELLPLCIEFAVKKHDEGRLDPHEVASRIANELGVDDIDAYASDAFKTLMEEGVGLAFESADAAAIAAIFAKNSKPVMTAVMAFAQGSAGKEELVRALNELCFGSSAELQAVLQKSLHISDKLADEMSNALGPYAVSVYCFAATFKIYKSATDDAKAATQRRIEIERLANEALARLRAERSALDVFLSDWMLERIIPFSEGVQAIDRAVLEDDDDAYIAANSDLWKLLGRETGYSTASEFDDLMLSDDAFRL